MHGQDGLQTRNVSPIEGASSQTADTLQMLYLWPVAFALSEHTLQHIT